MSYSADDFFIDNIAPKMIDLFKNYNPTHLSLMEKFMQILKDAVAGDGNGTEKFKKVLLWALMDPHEEDLTIEDVVADFLSLYPNRELLLRKMEYSSGNSIISVDFQGLLPDED